MNRGIHAVFHAIKDLNTNKITSFFFLSLSAVISLQSSLLQAAVKAVNLQGFDKKRI